MYECFYNLLKFVVRFLCICLFRIRVEGRANFPKKEGVLIVSNHQSYLDPIFIGVVSPTKTYYFARSDLFRHKIFGALISFLGAKPLRRGEMDLSAAHLGIKLLSEKKTVVIFPEGTRSKDGNIGKIHTGSLVIAKKTNVAILPCFIDGSFKVLPRGKKFIDFREVRLFFGRSFYLDKNAKSDYIVETLRSKFSELQQKSERSKKYV